MSALLRLKVPGRTAPALALAVGAVAFGISASRVDAAAYSYPAFNPAPSGVSTTWRNEALGSGAPAGTYVGYQVLADWTGGNTGTSGQWGNEARAFLSSAGGTGTGTTPTGAGTAYTSNARQAQNGANNNFDVPNLRWRGGLSTAYAGGSPLSLNYRQTFSGTNANWSNVRVSVYTTIDEALGVTNLGTIGPGLTTTTSLYTRDNAIQWYKFSVPTVSGGSGQYLSIDTFGNTLTGGQFGAGDTELSLYNSSGALVVTNDDHRPLGPSPSPLVVESLIIAGSQAASPFATAAEHGNAGATLPAGDYYLAIGPYNMLSLANFDVSDTIDPLIDGSEKTGTYQINFNTNVIPEPASLTALAGASLLMFTRRRRQVS